MKKNIVLILIFSLFCVVFAQPKVDTANEKEKKIEFLKELKTTSDEDVIGITTKSVNLTNFPIVKVIIEAYNKRGEPLDTLTKDQVMIFENGRNFPVISVEKIPVVNNYPWDFVFALDITGSMQPQIDAVMANLNSFTNNMRTAGIDYRLGLVLFSDNVERVFQPTADPDVFINWINKVKAYGGGDEKENALEALNAVLERITFREDANRVVILVTDAPYHQKGEKGDGYTRETTNSMIEKLVYNDVRVFTIVPPRLKQYSEIAEKTRGTNYDIGSSFAALLGNFARQITNTFLVTYKSTNETVPDSIEIGLFDQASNRVIKKTIPVVELGRKIIIENLLFSTAKYYLPENVRELNILATFMKDKTTISVIVEGHTDAIGSHQLNDLLSQRRADAVRNYLIAKGIDKSRIASKGYGKRKPIASNDTEFGRGLNRRTEIVIISK